MRNPYQYYKLCMKYVLQRFKGSKAIPDWPEWACRIQQHENMYTLLTQMQHTNIHTDNMILWQISLHQWPWDLLLSCPERRTPESASYRGIRRHQTVWHDSLTIGHNPKTYIAFYHWALYTCIRENWELQYQKQPAIHSQVRQKSSC